MEDFTTATGVGEILQLIASVSDFIFSHPILFAVVSILAGGIIVWILFKLFVEMWLFHRRAAFKDDIKWCLLEIIIPREVNRTPRAMEQFFMSIHGLRNAAGDFLEKYIDGEVTLWWSFELASFGGEVHFFIRTPHKHKKMTEASLYAQYPTVEVVEVEDYMKDFPANTREIYRKDYNIFGGELILRKSDPYPITTYEKFELSKDEMALDPISAVLETLGNVQKEENVFVQILAAPAGTEWQDPVKKLVGKMTGREESSKDKSGGSGGLLEFLINLFLAPVKYPEWTEAKKEESKEEKFSMLRLTPGEQDTVKAIEASMSKPAFEIQIRYMYYAPKAIFNTNFARRGLIGAFNQYASPSLNSFRGNSKVETRTRWIYWPYFFVKQRTEARKQRLLDNYRNRRMPEESSAAKLYTSHPFNVNFASQTFFLTVAELATIYHIPSELVLTAPYVKRLESKRMGPPAGLPIFEEEEKK